MDVGSAGLRAAVPKQATFVMTSNLAQREIADHALAPAPPRPLPFPRGGRVVEEGQTPSWFSFHTNMPH